MPSSGFDRFKPSKKGDQRKVHPEPQESDQSEKARPEKQLKKGGLHSLESYVKAYEYQKEIKYKKHYERYKKFVKSELQKLSDRVTDLHKQSKKMERQFKFIKRFMPFKKILQEHIAKMYESQKIFMKEYRKNDIDYTIIKVENRINLNQLGWATMEGKGLPFHEGPGREYMMKLYQNDSEWDELRSNIDHLKELKLHIDNAQWKKSYEKQESQKREKQRIINEEKYKKAENNKLNVYDNKIKKIEKQYLDLKQEIKQYTYEGKKLPDDVFFKAKKLDDKLSGSKNNEFMEKYNYKDLEVRRSEYKEKLKYVWKGLDKTMKGTRFSIEWQTRNVNFGNLEGQERYQAALAMVDSAEQMKKAKINRRESNRQDDRSRLVLNPDGKWVIGEVQPFNERGDIKK